MSAAAAMAVAAVTLIPTTSHAGCQSVPLPPVTVGVGGEPVATTPAVSVSVCVDGEVQTKPIVLPDVRVEPTGSGGAAVYLSLPGRTYVESASVSYSVDGQGETVFVPIGVGSESSTICLLYVGSAYDNPGGCEVFVEY